jgi:non-specific serine/threonine protein kinase/serine/threonine-protein kinase
VNAEFWREVKEVFAEAVELPPGERIAFLDEKCEGKPDVRAEVESLLSSFEDAGTFIDTPIARATSLLDETETNDAAEREDRTGVLCGPWRLTELIGEGGMGAVYKAVRHDDEFEKLVAVKLLKHSFTPSAIVSRFRTERQILASLDHPNIARLLDGGSAPDGTPFFVMEYIEGQSITEYCDSNRLNTTQRLELFRQVCNAVHYAHQNLIVHRDLKPRNILVTSDGVPKLLDFGIAKLLSPDTVVEETRTHMRLMTPEYASPEQIRGEQVNTTSDVYSLGVVLYELLTGHRPYRLKAHTPIELERAVLETDPDRPSTVVRRTEEITQTDGTPYVLTPELVSFPREGRPDRLSKRLSGDVDNIILMAMRKERERRYASAGQLAEDIRRHLASEPVVARPDTLSYRTSKFVSRNKVTVGAAALVFVTLIGALGATTWALQEARRERARAERRFSDVRKLANSFLFEFDDAIEKLPGATPARALIVRKALEYLDSLASESSGDPGLQNELASAYEHLAEIQGEQGAANLGDTKGAIASIRKAIVIRESAAKAQPNNLENRRTLAASIGSLGRLLRATGGNEEAAQLTRRALEIRQQLAAADPANEKFRSQLAVAHWEVGGIFRTKEDFKSALEHYNKAVEITQKLATDKPQSRIYQHNFALYLKTSAGAMAQLKDYTGAINHLTRARKIEEKLIQEKPTDADELMNLSYTLGDIGFNYAQTGRLKEAIESYREALKIREKMFEADPSNARAQAGLGTTLNRLGRLYLQAGDNGSALDCFARALVVRKQLVATRPIPQDRSDLALNYVDLGDLYVHYAKQAKSGQRQAELRKALDHYLSADKIFAQMREEKQDFAIPPQIVEPLAKAIANTRRDLGQ